MHEAAERDVDVRAVLYAALAIAGGIAFALVGSWLMLHLLGPASNAPDGMSAGPAIPAPRVQTAPQPERAAYFTAKERRLATYGWVDRNAGIAHIPLDDAMALLAAQAASRPAREGGRHE